MNKKRHSAAETSLVILTIIAVGFVLSKIHQVAIPFMLAFLISLILAPIMRFGIKHKIPPSLMAVIILAMLAGFCLPLGIFIGSRMQGMLETLPSYYNELLLLSESLLDDANLPKDFLANFNWQNTIGRYLSGMTGFLLSWFNTLTMVIIFLLFMLMEYPYVDTRLKRAFSGQQGEVIREVAYKIVTQISRYLQTLTVISAITGLCVWAALSLLGVNFPLTWGIVAFLLNFIPTIGSILASIPPILVAIVQFFPNWGIVTLTIIALLSIQFTLGNILTPKIMGDALDLSPIVILISLLFWGLILGFTGALLAVPLAAIIKIICENIPRLKFLAILMSSSKEKS